MNQEQLKSFLQYEAETGKIYWKKTVNSRGLKGTEAGSITKQGRRRIQISGHRILSHRVAWFLWYGEWPISELDHINGNPLDNRIQNLREVTRRENEQNRPEHRAGKLPGYKRSRSKRNPYEAQVRINGKHYYLGSYKTEKEASEAYFNKIRELSLAEGREP